MAKIKFDENGKMIGTEKRIKTPEELYQHFEAYKAEVKSNPRIQQDFVGGKGAEVNRLKEQPLTFEGFHIYCWKNDICKFVEEYFTNRKENADYSAYANVAAMIKKEIREDQITGGMCGIYQPQITQRLNGLVDKKETDVNLSIDQIKGMNIT